MEEILTINFAESFGTFSGLATLNVVIVNLITTYFKIKKGWIKQVISWLIPIVISIIGVCILLGQKYGNFSKQIVKSHRKNMKNIH